MLTQFQFKNIKSSLPCVCIPHFVIYYQVFQCVNKQTTHAYCIVTSKHADRSYWQALIYIRK